MIDNWYGIARRRGGWTVIRCSEENAVWLRRHCEVKGPFPIRDIARLACGQRLSKSYLYAPPLSTLHGDGLVAELQRYGMKRWPAIWLAMEVDKRELVGTTPDS